MQPRPEIIILGNDDGAARAASEFGIRHGPLLEPLTDPPSVDVIFGTGERLASHSLMAYVNADIILGQRFMLAAQEANRAFDDPFLMTGLRWDLMSWHGLDIGGPDWWSKLELRLMESGQFHTSTGADYFVFRRCLYPEIPPYYIGHSAWDNWLIMDVVRDELPVVNATPFVRAVHHGLERCDITDPRYKHNQEIWWALDPQRGEGMIESAGWVIDLNGKVLKDGRPRTDN